ncbi:MAG: tryptophan--tRNA ligase [Candidatus Altiarchaeota archaeon]|nr:tryptophan--tRNA ligase [Candidatus Altiarchaeota archaeon]
MAERIDPWGSGEVQDYRRLMTDFGIEPMEPYREAFKANRYIRRGIIFGHRDFGRIADSILKKKPYVMMTGLMPSGKFHFGHKMVADQIIWHQSCGASVYVCAADLEAYVVRNIPLAEAREIAITEYLTNYLALGLKPPFTFWFQTDYKVPYYRLRDMMSKEVTFNELKAIYGEITTGKIFSAITQSADILHPQLSGPQPTVVPVGVDQDPHIRLTRDIAARMAHSYKMVAPSATYHTFMSGLSGGKMSSSNPASYIALTDAPEVAKKKVMSAKTGGRATVEEQKKLGGVPDSCSVYELCRYHLIEDDKKLEEMRAKCESGMIMCGECKKNCAGLLERFLIEHQKKRVEAGRQARKLVEELR